MINHAQQARSKKEKERLYQTQAIYIYELSDITLDLINKLSLDGKDTILKLYAQAETRKEQRLKNIQQQVNKAKELQKMQLISEDELAKEKEQYSFMSQANEQSMKSWKSLKNRIKKQENFLNNLKSKKALIEYKRDQAKLQLETLRDMREISELRNTIGSFDSLIESVSNLDLLVLDKKTVEKLLGLASDE